MSSTHFISPNLLMPRLLPQFTEIEEALDFHLTPPVIALIADYADVTRKVDTTVMIQIFLNGIKNVFSPLPDIYIERAKETFPDCLTCLGTKAQTPPLKGAVVLKKTPEKKLITYARIYFDFLAAVQLHNENETLDTDEGYDIVQAYEKEWSDFSGKIHGFEVLKKADIKVKFICHMYVFMGQSWFDPIESYDQLFDEPNKVLSYLESVGYQKLDKLKPGAVLVYCTSTEVNHYGIIDSIEENGDVWVRSKFGVYYVNRHLMEVCFYRYGNQVFAVEKS